MISWFPVIALTNVKALLAPMSGISDAVKGIMLNNLVSEVDIMKYQQLLAYTMPSKVLQILTTNGFINPKNVAASVEVQAGRIMPTP